MPNSGLFVLLVLLAACGGRDAASGKETASATTGQNGAAESPNARSACDLATEAEIGALAGTMVRAEAGRAGRGWSTCEYMGTANDVPYLSVTAHFSNGGEAFETYRAGMGIAGDMMRAAEGVELDSIVKPGPVPGLGDAAIYVELGPSVVLDGDHFLELMLFYMPDARAKFRPLAEMLLARM